MASAPLAADPLASYQGKARVLLVLAPETGDVKLARQRAIFKGMGSGARERDLTLVEILGDTAQASVARQRFGIADRGFHAILIGKDGGDKLSSDDPLDAEALFPLIDSMPMRQREMRRGS